MCELGLIVIFYSSSFEANAIIAVVFLRERVRYQDVFGKFKVPHIISALDSNNNIYI